MPLRALELKIPPPLLVLITAFLMWLIAWLTPGITRPHSFQVEGAALLALFGISLGVAGVLSFRRAKTTVNPTKPHSSSALVSSGIYTFTRNPMYLGLLLALCGWAVFLSNVLTVVGLFVFVGYMNRFQIAPEEAALSALFGEEFRAYAARTRRWL